jgi:hypothetical protein
MIPVSLRTKIAAARTVKEPNLVLCIDGAPYCMGAATIKRIVNIGDPGLLIDGSWQIGGVVELDTQRTLISTAGSSTSVKQQLDADKGRGSSIQSMDIALIDIEDQVTELITPGLIMDDILARKAKIYMALDQEAVWPLDYVLLFRGVVDDVKSAPGIITLTIAHPEQKKKQSIYDLIESNIVGAITNSQTTIPLVDTTGMLKAVVGPSGATDNTNFRSYIRIDDELIEYTGISGNNLTGCVRGSLNTFPATHADQAKTATFYRLLGTCMDIALKVMLAKGGDYLSGIAVSAIQVIPDVGSVANALYFENQDLVVEFGPTIGDYISTTGMGAGANNFTLRQITSIIPTEHGSYFTVDGAALVDESPALGTVSFRSQYDTFPAGLGLGGDEVDVAQHQYLDRQFLSSFTYDIYIKATIENARDWLDTEIYKPASAYSLPRKTQASVQLLLGPIPGSQMLRISKANVVKPSNVKLRRSVNRNFYNTIIYRFDEDELTENFVRGVIHQEATSLTQIPVGTRPMVISSKGLRTTANAFSLAQSAATRRLNRFAYGAEFLEGVSILFGDGFDLEVGDITILDPTDLHMSNTSDGTRVKPPALFEVVNKSLNWRTGEITVDLLDTGFDPDARYCLVAPSSYIASASSQTVLTIAQNYYSVYGSAEFQKWQHLEDCSVVVRSPDYTTRYAVSTIRTADSNTIELDTALGFVPQPGDVMELSKYPNATDQIKLTYGHMSPLLGGADSPYIML